MGLDVRDNAPELVLLAGLILSAVGSFVPVGWTPGLEVVVWISVGGLVVGFLLAQSVFRPRVAHAFSLVYGSIATAVAAASRLSDDASLRCRVIEIGLRTWSWLGIAWQGKGQSSDSLVFVLELSLLSWWTGYIAAWFVFRRRQVWGVIAPSGLLLFWNLFFSPLPLIGYRFTYLLCAFLLVSRIALRRRQAHWRQSAIDFRPEIAVDFLRYGTTLVLCIVTLAWLIPPLTHASVGPLVDWMPVEKLGVKIQQEWQRLFAELEYPLHGPAEAFGLELQLSDPVGQSTGAVMTVAAPFRRYYWRAVAYDEYSGRGWRDTDTNLALLDAFVSPRRSDAFIMRQEVTQSITMHTPGATVLFAAAQLERVSLPAKVYYSTGRDIDSSEQLPLSPSLWQAHRALGPEAKYSAVSSLSIASDEDLRTAGSDYPSWVLARYLQLPETLPTRVISLAHSVAGPVYNPYDQARALEDYLRTIPYNEQVDPAPAGKTDVDYFLFDAKEGYCTHYASALVVMARTMGIPARLAAGYSSGEFDQQNGVFMVSRSNGHAWPEVFFPEYGWVEFEPTATEPVIVRPRPVVIEGEEEDSHVEEETNGDQSEQLGGYQEGRLSQSPRGLLARIPISREWRGSLSAVLGLGAVATAALGAWGARQWWVWRQFTPTAWSYGRLIAFGRQLNCPISTGQTPYQYGQELARIVPGARPQIEDLVALYMAERFGRHRAAADETAELWHGLRLILLRSWIRQRWTLSFLRRRLRALLRAFG